MYNYLQHCCVAIAAIAIVYFAKNLHFCLCSLMSFVFFHHFYSIGNFKPYIVNSKYHFRNKTRPAEGIHLTKETWSSKQMANYDVRKRIIEKSQIARVKVKRERVKLNWDIEPVILRAWTWSHISSFLLHAHDIENISLRLQYIKEYNAHSKTSLQFNAGLVISANLPRWRRWWHRFDVLIK